MRDVASVELSVAKIGTTFVWLAPSLTRVRIENPDDEEEALFLFPIASPGMMKRTHDAPLSGRVPDTRVSSSAATFTLPAQPKLRYPW